MSHVNSDGPSPIPGPGPELEGGAGTVGVVRNTRMRMGIVGFGSLPFLLMVSSVLSVAPVMLGRVTVMGSLVIIAVSEVVCIVWALSYMGARDRWRDVLAFHRPSRWWWPVVGAAGGVAMFVALQLIATGLSKMGIPITSSDTSQEVMAVTGWQRVVVLGVFVPFVAPFLEELYFRGYTLHAVQGAMSGRGRGVATGIGVAVSAVAFSLAHFQGLSSASDVLLLVWIGLIAVVNAFLVLKSGSVLTSFCLHCCYNAATVLAGLVVLNH